MKCAYYTTPFYPNKNLLVTLLLTFFNYDTVNKTLIMMMTMTVTTKTQDIDIEKDK